MNKMRRIIMGTSLIMIAAFMANNLNAQPGRNADYGQGKCKQYTGSCQFLPDLTEEQQKQIETLKVAHLKEMQQLRNKMNENKAKLQTLETSDKPDADAINKTIESIGAIKISMMKERSSHRQEVRKLLTEEQRIYFDMHHSHRGKHKPCYGHGRGCGAGQGNGPRSK